MTRRQPGRRLPALFLAGLLSACTGSGGSAIHYDVPEIYPGILQGYIDFEEGLDSTAFVPLAPTTESSRQALDELVSEHALGLRDSPRWQLATTDADLSFPAAAGSFSCALGVDISEEHTPALYLLMRRTVADIGLASYGAKQRDQRPRPFMVNDRPLCTPEHEEMLRDDGSYPSGHSAIGWGWALILAELAPERAEALLQRGRTFGESRLVCNVHWYSDVIEGRMVAAAAVARLHANDEFQATLDAAGAEIRRARTEGLSPAAGTCALEQRALETPALPPAL